METLNQGLATEDLRRWVLDFAHGILDQHEALSDLDAASGDADHGSNMRRGMSSLLQAIPGWGEKALPGEFLKDVGMHIVSSVGGSSGALYGTIFLRMARTVGGASALDAQLLARAFEAAGEGVAERGHVKQGDKTMYDALAPAIHALRGGSKRATGRSQRPSTQLRPPPKPVATRPWAWSRARASRATRGRTRAAGSIPGLPRQRCSSAPPHAHSG